MATPLEGITVLDLSRGGPGVFCTMVLGDLGAEVIQIGEPGQRRQAQGAPAFSEGQREERRNAAFNPMLRNKKSVSLNLRHPEALKALYRLVEKADVFVEGFRPGVASRLGVDYAALKELNARLVYCSITSYGQDGPYKGVGGHDINYMAIGGGMVDIQKQEDGRFTATNMVGIYTGRGVVAALGIVAALLAREKSGSGQYVDISLADSTLYLLAPLVSRFLSHGELPVRGEPDLTGTNPYYAIYEAKDGRLLSVACGEPHIFAALMTALGRTEWIGHQRERSLYPAISAFLRETFRSRTRDEWFKDLSEKGVSVAKVNSLSDVTKDPQMLHRKMILDVGSVEGEVIKQVGIGPKLAQTPGAVRSLGVVEGSNSLEVLQGVGFSAEQLEVMRREGAL